MSSYVRIQGQRGFTLVELSIVLLVMAIIAGASTPMVIDRMNANFTNQVVETIQQVTNAAMTRRVRDSEWPDATNNCADPITVLDTEGLLPVARTSTPFETDYNYACPVDGSGDRPVFEVTVDLPTEWANEAASRLGAAEVNPTGSTNRSTLRVVRTLPMAVAAFDGVLARENIAADTEDQRNRMETELRVGQDSDNDGVIDAGTTEAMLGWDEHGNAELDVEDVTYQGQDVFSSGNQLYGARASMSMRGFVRIGGDDTGVSCQNAPCDITWDRNPENVAPASDKQSVWEAQQMIPEPRCPADMTPAITHSIELFIKDPGQPLEAVTGVTVDHQPQGGGGWLPRAVVYQTNTASLIPPEVVFMTTCRPTGAPGDSTYETVQDRTTP